MWRKLVLMIVMVEQMLLGLSQSLGNFTFFDESEIPSQDIIVTPEVQRILTFCRNAECLSSMARYGFSQGDFVQPLLWKPDEENNVVNGTEIAFMGGTHNDGLQNPWVSEVRWNPIAVPVTCSCYLTFTQPSVDISAVAVADCRDTSLAPMHLPISAYYDMTLQTSCATGVLVSFHYVHYGIGPDIPDGLKTTEAPAEAGGFECARRSLALDLQVNLEDTMSFRSHNLETMSRQLPALFDKLMYHFKTLRVGFSSFCDKPIEPYGKKASQDYCVAQGDDVVPMQPMHQRVTDAVLERLKRMSKRRTDGGDDFQNSLGALHFTTLTSNWETGLDNGFRVQLVITSKVWHQEGDTLLPASGSTGGTDCASTDYVSVSTTAQALKKTGANFIFMLMTDDSATVSSYQALVSELQRQSGLAGAVVQFKEWASVENICSDLLKVLNKICDRIETVVSV